MTTATPTLSTVRRQAVDDTLARIRALAAGEPDRAGLAAIAAELARLAERKDLFPRADFPPPAASEGVGASTRYRLNPQDGSQGLALYLNSINPGKTTLPHNHDSWAVIVAVEGREENRVYRRTDDGSDPTHARLELVREATVQPGTSIEFLAQDLHSIHVVGDQPTLHFHLYGKPLEQHTGRIGVRLESGEVVNYNATQFEPSKDVA
ncbi:cysteine dioxygenase family protein [Azohydromonas lata]|uniref:Cysteine dioxygenase family protein n=1 Tax=Azohydromonas lata TaxID=45677 RepID=A0ABU5IFU2_9BURK|nr:cysteine dioxygenase family protein [Azohydromonas lata]MDZ5457997.1 cysteine dioxygenase family protein [Azohydromonas lata]